MEADFNGKLSMMKIKVDETEVQYKTNEENFKPQILNIERENAVLKQTIEFLEIKLKDSLTQIEEQKKNYKNIISSLESKTFSMIGHEEFQKQVDEIKLYFESEKKAQEESYVKSRTLYTNQIDSFTEKLNEADFKAKVEKEEVERECNELKTKFEKLNKEFNILFQEKKNISESLANSSEDTMNKIKAIQDEFERNLKEKERLNQNEISDLNKNSEETISQIKALFETEKIRFEDSYREKSKN